MSEAAEMVAAFGYTSMGLNRIEALLIREMNGHAVGLRGSAIRAKAS